MTSNKNITSTPGADLVPVPTAVKEDPTKRSPPVDIRPTVSKPPYQDPMTTIVAIHRNNQIPDSTNIQVDPTKVFKTIISDITEALTFIIAPMLDIGYLLIINHKP